MNIPSLSLSLLAAAALLVSCAQDELSGGVALPAGNALHVSSAVIATGSGTEMEIAARTQTKSGTRADASTRADVLVSVTSGSLGIFRSQGTNYISTLDNLQYTYIDSDKGWQPATTSDTIYLNGDDAEVCAYYPYNGDATYSNAATIPVCSGKYIGFGAIPADYSYNGIDLCYATNRTLNGSQRATTFEMKHAMAMLEFKISKEAGYKGDCRITSVSIQNPELLSESQLNITNGTYTTASGATKGKLTYNPGTDDTGILIESTATTTAALLVPFKPTTAGLTITFVTNGVNVEADIPASKIANVEAGKRYTVSITMKAASMQVTGVDMVPWDEIGVGGDDYTWYPTEDVIKLTSPIHIASYDWAWSNLEKVGTSYQLGSFQKLTGSLWPWKTLEPMPEPVKKGDAPNPGSGAYQYAQDPCSKLDPAGKWTLPNQQQINLLLATDHINTPNGCWFGTSTAIDISKDDGTCLFLPANNLLTYHGGVGAAWLTALHDGLSGYWTSIDAAQPQQQMLTVGGNENLNLTGLPVVGIPFTSDNNPTYYAASIRCVEKARETITIDGVEWAMGNLVLKDDGTYVIDSYQGAVPPHIGGMQDTNWEIDVTAGYHFTWNELNRVDHGEDYPAYAYDADNDPCAKVKPEGTWRTPTKTDFDKAMAQGGPVEGTYYINNTAVKGYYLGVGKAPAKGGGDDYLFLPTIGGGDRSTYYNWQCDYWTSTESGTANGNAAYKFQGASLVTESMKGYPAAIRCVKGSLEKIYTLTQTEEVKIGSVTYARTNLNHDYTLEAEPWISGMMNGKDDDYWTFGMKDPTLTGMTAGTSYYDGTDNWDVLTGINEDPCKSVPGGKWRLPTSKELEQLQKYFLPEGAKVLVNGEVMTVTTNGKVTTDTKSTAGSVFYDATTKNTLFIPYTGNSNGTSYLGTAAVLHSSEVYGKDCKTLACSGGTFQIGVPGYIYRYGGNAIRCVKK